MRHPCSPIDAAEQRPGHLADPALRAIAAAWTTLAQPRPPTGEDRVAHHRVSTTEIRHQPLLSPSENAGWSSLKSRRGDRVSPDQRPRPSFGHPQVQLRPTPPQHRPPDTPPPRRSTPRHHRIDHRQTPRLPRPMEPQPNTYPLKSKVKPVLYSSAWSSSSSGGASHHESGSFSVVPSAGYVRSAP